MQCVVAPKRGSVLAKKMEAVLLPIAPTDVGVPASPSRTYLPDSICRAIGASSEAHHKFRQSSKTYIAASSSSQSRQCLLPTLISRACGTCLADLSVAAPKPTQSKLNINLTTRADHICISFCPSSSRRHLLLLRDWRISRKRYYTPAPWRDLGPLNSGRAGENTICPSLRFLNPVNDSSRRCPLSSASSPESWLTAIFRSAGCE